MKYVRKKCVLCSSSRKEEKVRKFSNYNVCNICISKNAQLKSYIKEYDKLLEGKYLKDIKNEIEADVVYTKNGHADKKIEEIITSLIDENQDKREFKKKILKKVEKKVNQKNKKQIKKTLNEFSVSDLKDCDTSLDEASRDLEKMKENLVVRKKTSIIDIPDPKSIVGELSSHVIDQDEAVNSISISLIQHLCRKRDPKIPKNNILLLGPTGTGKTEIARFMSKFLNIPLVIMDSTSLTSEGYVGASLNDTLINSLMAKANGKQEVAENSIVFIDEIDKKAVSRYNESGINTIAIQNELLKILEGSEIRGQYQDGKHMKKISLNTSNILFICAGAFSQLEEKMKNKNKGGIGLSNDKKEIIDEECSFSKIKTEDLIEYGLTPEFLGRFSTITYTTKLSNESLFKILTTKKNSIVSQYERIFKQFNVDVVFTDEFLYSIIDEVNSQGIGARGLYKVFSKRIKPILLNVYSFVDKKLVINKEDFILN